MIGESRAIELPLGRTSMILEQFRAWAHAASPAARAEGAAALARAYLRARSNEKQRYDAAAVLTSFLDDPSPLVRRALAEALASAPGAPHHIILALADDMPAIACIVLAASPLLTDAELIDCATTADPLAQAAIAGRGNLAAAVAATLAEVGAPQALVALADNPTAALSESAIRRMIERYGDDVTLRAALLARAGLPVGVRVDLVAAGMKALALAVAEREWMPEKRLARIGREARDRAAIAIADTSRGAAGALELAHALRRSGDLTASLVFRAILGGRLELFKAALGVLAEVPAARVDEQVAHCEGAGFAALHRKAGLPADLLAPIRIALAAARDADWSERGAGLSCSVVERVLTGCEAINDGRLDTLVVLLRRFEAEAAREATRPPARDLARGALRLGARDAEPLLLKERATSVALVPRRQEPRGYTIDMAAIAAELCAA